MHGSSLLASGLIFVWGLQGEGVLQGYPLDVEVWKLRYRVSTGQLSVKDQSYKCRLCATCCSNPNELRAHAMEKHKGHMLTIKR